MNARGTRNVRVWDREAPPDWRSGCVTLLVVFAAGLLIGLWMGVTAPRSGQATAPTSAPTGSDDAQALRMTLRPTVTVATPTPSASPALSRQPYSARPTPEQIAHPTGVELAMEAGIASHMGTTQGPRYLALPGGAGHHVIIRGPIGFVERVSTDAGPDLAMQRAGRVADLNVYDFEKVCGPRTLGTCHVTVEYL